MKFLTVDVTKEDIKEGQIPTREVMDRDHYYSRATQCPVAIALKRVYPKEFSVGWETFASEDSRWDSFPMTKRLRNFVHQADRQHNKPNPTRGLKPQRFRIRYA